MNKTWIQVLIVLLLFLCTACQTETPVPATPTPLPPTLTHAPLPPTETSVPPTPTPNPYAETLLRAFAESLNENSYEKALTLVSDEIQIVTGQVWFLTYEGISDLEDFLTEAHALPDYHCAFSDFEVNGDIVNFKWVRSFTYHAPPQPDKTIEDTCKAKAELIEDKISYIEATCATAH